MDQDQDF